jgi:hypothetical protein
MCFTAARVLTFCSALHHIYLPLQQRSLSQMSGRGLADFPPVWPQKQTARRRRRCLFCCTPLAGEEICECADLFTCDSRRRTSQFPSRIINIRRAPLPTTLKVQAPAAPSRRPNQRAHRKYVHKSSFTEASEEMITAQETTPQSRLESYYFCR